MDESTDDASADTVRYALVVRRAVVLCALAITLWFLAVLTPIVAHVDDDAQLNLTFFFFFNGIARGWKYLVRQFASSLASFNGK